MKTPEIGLLTETSLFEMIPPDNIYVILILFIFLMLGIILWLEVYEFPRQRRYKALWLKRNTGLLESERLLIQLLDELGKESTCCSKCGHYEMRIWDIRDRFLIIRCTQCQMNRTLCEESRPIIRNINQTANSITKILEVNKLKKHEMLSQYLHGSFQFNNSRKPHRSTPISAITFQTASGNSWKSR